MTDDKRDEWHVEPTLMHELGHLVMEGNRPIAICPRESEALRVVADHNARTQLEERVRELEALAQEKATQVYISWREKTYELVEVFVKCPHCHREEILGDGSASYPKNPPAVIANFKHADNCWLTRFTALLSPQECSGTKGEGK